MCDILHNIMYEKHRVLGIGRWERLLLFWNFLMSHPRTFYELVGVFVGAGLFKYLDVWILDLDFEMYINIHSLCSRISKYNKY